MAPAFQNTLIFNPDIINYGRFSFWKLDNAVSLQQKKILFSLFLDTKPFFTMKIANQYNKQLTPSESLDWDDDFFEPWFGVSSNSNRRGTQIRVNTWTVSYIKLEMSCLLKHFQDEMVHLKTLATKRILLTQIYKHFVNLYIKKN